MGDLVHAPITGKVRCPECNFYLMDVEPIYCSENTNATVEIRTKCPSRKCKKDVSFSFKICPKNRRVAMPGKKVSSI